MTSSDFSYSCKMIVYDLSFYKSKKVDPDTRNSENEAFKDHEFWLRLFQKKMSCTGGNISVATDFLKSGISYNRTNKSLLYNFACAQEQ